MDVVTYTKARQNFTETMKKVCDDHAPLMITRKNEPPVIMMSLEDYNSWEETIYLMRSTANAEKLLKSIENARQGKVTKRELIV